MLHHTHHDNIAIPASMTTTKYFPLSPLIRIVSVDASISSGNGSLPIDIFIASKGESGFVGYGVKEKWINRDGVRGRSLDWIGNQFVPDESQFSHQPYLGVKVMNASTSEYTVSVDIVWDDGKESE